MAIRTPARVTLTVELDTDDEQPDGASVNVAQLARQLGAAIVDELEPFESDDDCHYFVTKVIEAGPATG